MSDNIKSVYLAGPLFTHGERALLGAVKGELVHRGYHVREPWEFCSDCVTDSSQIARRCIAELLASDLVLACLDGADVDSGTAFECGYAVALGYAVIGFRSDFRGTGDDAESKVNAMFRHLDEIIALSPTDTLPSVAVQIVNRVDAHFKRTQQ